MNKTIYTAIFGEYDFLKSPEVVTPAWDYICYSDRAQDCDTWKVKITPPQWGPIKSARAIKILHGQYTPPGISVWADASMRIKGNLDDFLSRYHHGDFVICDHPDRNCIYEEATACIRFAKDNPDTISSQVHGYRIEGYPANAGMVSSGVIIRSAPHKKFTRMWWDEVRTKSCRDQLSFNYIARHCRLDYMVMPFEEVTSDFFAHHYDHPRQEKDNPPRKIVGI